MKFFVITSLEQHVFQRLMILFDKKLLFLRKQSYLFEMLDDRGVYESFCGIPFLNKKIKQIWGESALCPLKINFTTCSLLLWFVKYTPYLCDRHQQSWLFSLLMFCFRKQEISYIKKFHVTLQYAILMTKKNFHLAMLWIFFLFLATCAKIQWAKQSIICSMKSNGEN